MRTDKENKKFAEACAKLEKRGGDVLGYITWEYPSITPEATWYRLQKSYLKRCGDQITDGKPREGEKYMSRMQILAMGALEAHERGESVYDYLESQDIKNASVYWDQLKQAMRRKDPEIYEKIASIQAIPKKPGSMTCCAPARESGVTVPDEIPEEKLPEPMEIVGVRSRVKGYYMKSEVNPALVDGNRYVHLIWRDLVTREERSIGLSVEEWKKLAEEIPQAMKQLGF